MNELFEKVTNWWIPMSHADRDYYVKLYEGGWVPVAALSDGAIVRLYLKVVEGLTYQQTLQKYHQLFNKKTL